MALFKRKDKENKKGSENAIGKIIYGFLLFMPLLSIGARCLYVIFNKNAYQSYSEYVENKTVTLNSGETLIEGIQYTVSYKGGLYNGNTYYVQDGKTNIRQIFFPNETWTVNNFNPTYEGQRTRLIVYDTNNVQHNFFNWQDTSSEFYFVSNTNTTIPTTQQNYVISQNIITNGTLDNVFEYSIEQTEESNIYNWAKETGTYTVLHNTTSGIGITNQFIPMLMAYWLIVSVIYFLFDIALILIWAVHKKIHELQESI